MPMSRIAVCGVLWRSSVPSRFSRIKAGAGHTSHLQPPPACCRVSRSTAASRRSFVVGEAGSRTQVVSLWAALFTLLTLLFLGPLVAELPFAALAGIVIVAGAGLLTPAEFRALWRFRKTEFWLGIVTIAAVLLLGMLIGILIAAVFSLLEIALRAASPQTAVLGRLPGTDTYRRLRRSPDAETIPGLVIFRLDAPLFFANANHFREGVIRAVEAAPEPVTELLVDAEAMYDIDSTGAQKFLELLDELKARDINVYGPSRHRNSRRTLRGAEPRIRTDHIYLEIDDGVPAFLQRTHGPQTT